MLDGSGDEQFMAESRLVGAVALLEISSNTISFSVEHLDDDLKKANFTLKSKARLGNYPEGTNTLSPDGRDLAKDAIRRWHDNFIDTTRYNAIAFVGTGAMRDASDAQDFIAELEEEFGFKLDVISGKQEAYYAARAVGETGITIDQGGRSCEFAITTDDGRIVKKRSLPLGAFDILAQGENAKDYIKQQLATLPKAYRQGLYETLYVVGGGPREIVKSYNKSDAAEDTISKDSSPADDLLKHAKAIAKADPDALTPDFKIATDRAETAPANALLLRHIIKDFGVSDVVPCKDGIRQAILAELRETAASESATPRESNAQQLKCV